MKRLIALTLVSIAAFIGCKATTYQHAFPDGSLIKVSDRRLFMGTQAGITFDISTNGAKHATIDVKSDANADAMRAVAEGVATGLVKGGVKAVAP